MTSLIQKPVLLDVFSRLITRILDSIDRSMEWVERRFGMVGASAFCGVILLIFASIYTTPGYRVVNNGTFYADMASHPFAFEDGNPFRYRILSSLLAYFLGLRGSAYIFFPLLVAIVFLGAVYFWFRRWQFSRIESWLVASLMAFSSPILFLLHFQGYTDVLTHLLLFLAYAYRNNRALWATMFGLSMLNHEATIFSAPVVLYFSCRGDDLPGEISSQAERRSVRWLKNLLGLTLAILPYVLFKKFVQLPGEWLSVPYYLHGFKDVISKISRLAWFGIFEAFKLFWLLPIAALILSPGRFLKARVTGLLLAILAGVGQLIFSHDTSRHVGHAFLAILLAARYLRQDSANFGGFPRPVLALILVNFLVPQYYVGGTFAWLLPPLPLTILLYLSGFREWFLRISPWT